MKIIISIKRPSLVRNEWMCEWKNINDNYTSFHLVSASFVTGKMLTIYEYLDNTWMNEWMNEWMTVYHRETYDKTSEWIVFSFLL